MNRKSPRSLLALRSLLAIAALLFASAPLVRAQFQMPDPKQMSGIPRPVDDLPTGSVSVRLIRGELSNNVVNHPIELHVGDKVQTVNTDDAGRAQFDKLPAGASLKAVADVDGERLESQEFPAPAQGGIRLMLVATDKAKEAKAAAEASAPATAGQVVIGGESRLVIEPGDEMLQVYYVLNVQNGERTPVNPPVPFVFDMPSGCTGTSLLEGSTPKASVSKATVTVAPPFAPGDTLVQVGCDLPAASGSIAIDQKFPVAFEHLGFIVRKVGDMKLTSPQVARQQDMNAQGQTFIAAAGDTVAAGQPIHLELSGLPHHSEAPLWVALSTAAGIILIGLFAARSGPPSAGKQTERKQLLARRDKLFQEFVRLETDHRAGRMDPQRYAARREQLLQSLEQVYGALDTGETSPEPAGRPDVAA